MGQARPLALVGDDDLLDDLLRVAAAAGCELERVPDAGAIRARWTRAPLVVLDEKAATDCEHLGLPRRSGVVLIAQGTPPPVLFERGVGIGAERVIGLPDAEPWLAGALADAMEGPVADGGRVLAVLGGRGGAGASIFAAAVGFAALRDGRRALLVDCDPLAGGLDLVLGAESESGLRWPELKLSGGRVATSSLHSALPGKERGTARLTVLSCDRASSALDVQAVSTVVTSARRSGEVVVCDLPRHRSEPSRAVLDRADLTVLVVPAEVRACAAARRVVTQLLDEGAHAQVLVRGPAPGGLRADEVAQAVGLPLLTGMRSEPGLAATLERGQPPSRSKGPLAAAAEATLDVLCGADNVR
jgi:secretion/DNA translocation related CpaE-like protein